MRSSSSAAISWGGPVSDAGPVRAFLALPPDPMWGESARGLVDALRPASPEAAWTKPSGWHMTLKFLGEAARRELEEFAGEGGRAAASIAPGVLRSAGAAVFPERGPARVLAVGFTGSEALVGVERLVSVAESAARRLGLEAENRVFRPHVTLARLKSRWTAPEVERFRTITSDWTFPPWQTRTCVLYGSRLGPNGAVHTPLAEWTLGGGKRGTTA